MTFAQTHSVAAALATSARDRACGPERQGARLRGD